MFFFLFLYDISFQGLGDYSFLPLLSFVALSNSCFGAFPLHIDSVFVKQGTRSFPLLISPSLHPVSVHLHKPSLFMFSRYVTYLSLTVIYGLFVIPTLKNSSLFTCSIRDVYSICQQNHISVASCLLLKLVLVCSRTIKQYPHCVQVSHYNMPSPDLNSIEQVRISFNFYFLYRHPTKVTVMYIHRTQLDRYIYPTT